MSVVSAATVMTMQHVPTCLGPSRVFVRKDLQETDLTAKVGIFTIYSEIG